MKIEEKSISDLDIVKVPKIYTFIIAMLYFGIKATNYITHERDNKRMGYIIKYKENW